MSGIYRLTCNTCKMSYIGQTSRKLNQRYPEHIRYIRNNDPQSAYAEHIIQNLHEYGSITDPMSLLTPINRTSMLILYEQLVIQKLLHNGNLIMEQGTGEKNMYILKSILILRRLMSYIYGAPILDVSRSHTTTQHSR